MNDVEQETMSVNSTQPVTETKKTRWMIYGANGYTGRLIVQVAKEKGEAPVIAGRNKKEIGTFFYRQKKMILKSI